MTKSILCHTVLCLAILVGCDIPDSTPLATPKPVPSILPAPIPRELREWNWGGGSCVHASTVMNLRRQNAMDLATFWRKTYAGGESYNGLTSKLKRNQVPYYATAGGGGQDIAGYLGWLDSRGIGHYETVAGDVDVLERCTVERRGGVIFYYPQHSILFCGFVGDKAYVLDNNRIESYIEIPKEEFISKWRGWGGVCVVPIIGNPPPPPPYIANR